MGVDIHVYLEGKKNKWDPEIDRYVLGDWESIDVYNAEGKRLGAAENRNYLLFDKLSGDGENVVQEYPRGIPDDSCDFIKNEWDEVKDDSGCYGISWIDVYELDLLVAAGKGKMEDWDGNECDPLKPFCRELEHICRLNDIDLDRPGVARAVFWYDC